MYRIICEQRDIDLLFKRAKALSDVKTELDGSVFIFFFCNLKEITSWNGSLPKFYFLKHRSCLLDVCVGLILLYKTTFISLLLHKCVI